MIHERERAALYLHDIERSIEVIYTFIDGMTLESFKEDIKTQDAVHMRLLVIGESVSNMQQKCPQVLEKHTQIPWREIRGMRNKMAHEYFAIIPERTWETIQKDLALLHEAVANIKQSDPELAECISALHSSMRKN